MSRVPVGAALARAPRLLQQSFSPAANVAAIASGVGLLWRHKRLIFEMAREELTGRHRGQWLGAAWTLVHPLALTLLYLFLFGIVFAQRVGGTREMPLDYTAYLLSGLMPWLTFQTAMTTSVNAITGNTGLVKQFTFPVEILPLRDVCAAMLTWVVGIGATLIYITVSQRVVVPTWGLLALVVTAQVLAMAGAGFVLSATAVFVRDVREILTLFVLIAMFLMPIFYLPGWVPALFQPLLWANPFTYMVWVYQDVIYFGRIEHPIAWVIYFGGSLLLFGWGVRVFRATRPLFSSAL